MNELTAQSSHYTMSRFATWLLLILVLRVVYLWFDPSSLNIEEAQYWAWGQYLSLGYYSKPPLIAWVLRFFSDAVGQTEFAVRLFSPIAYSITALFVYKTADYFFDRRVAFWSGLSLLLVPGVSYSAMLMSTDVLLLLFWSMALYFFAKACCENRGADWFGLGVALGLGTLSKYTMLAFLLSMGLYLLVSKEHRSRLKSIGPYGSLLIMLIFLSPNLYWNWQHGFVSARHVAMHNADIHGIHFHFIKLLAFLSYQVLLLGPLFFAYLVWLLCKRYLSLDKRYLFLWFFTWPWLLLICIEALLSRAYPNWSAPCYVSAVILVVACLVRWSKHRYLRAANGVNIILAVLWISFNLLNGYRVLPLPGSYAYNHYKAYTWSEVSHKIQALFQRHPAAGFLVNEREVWAEGLFYQFTQKQNTYLWDRWGDLSWYLGKSIDIPEKSTYIYMTEAPWLDGTVAGAMDSRVIGRYDVVNQFYAVKKHLTVYLLTNKDMS